MPALSPMTPADGVAWITGASSGIGAALALRLAKAGWRVAATARSADALADLETQSGGAIRAYPADLAAPDTVAAAVERIEAQMGPIALAVLNAGIYLPVNAQAPDLERFRKTFDVNLLGTAACLVALNPKLAARRKGQIAIVSSATGFGGMPTSAAYGASKAALTNMSQSLAIELHRWGVKVQVITPGFVETPAQDDNAFPKPFMISAESAAKRIAKGLTSNAFEITFPKRFTLILKAIYALPPRWFIPLVRRQTGWDKPIAADAQPNEP